ncbi:MAG: GNAT family N-acetyltransferase [Acutalibacteraceae bacterium]|nr:GNAT family N-acetyltransferase [Acutalibacteraceae bacterium]
MRFFTPSDEYLPQIKNLCSTCFDMESDEVEYVFENKYISTEICYAIEDNGKLCCMLFTVPCTMFFSNETIKGHYIYGACTMAEYRHRGLMHRLIEYTTKKSAEKGDAFSALLPANEKLYDFYGTMGYRPLYNAHNEFVKKEILPNLKSEIAYVLKENISFMANIRKKICSKYNGTVNYNSDIIKYAVKYANECSGGVVICKYGYIIYSYNDYNILIVQEIICDKKHLDIMLGLLKKICQSEKIMLRLPPWLSENNKHFGMVKILNNTVNTDEFNMAYLGLTFD